MGAQREEAISNLEAMGFERSQIEVAMRAAFFNPDRAVDYLLNVRDSLHILYRTTNDEVT
jgi:UV excision repair protein RAD23